MKKTAKIAKFRTRKNLVPHASLSSHLASHYNTIVAELLCGRRPQEWSPIPLLRGVLRGMLAIFYGHWQAE